MIPANPFTSPTPVTTGKESILPAWAAAEDQSGGELFQGLMDQVLGERSASAQVLSFAQPEVVGSHPFEPIADWPRSPSFGTTDTNVQTWSKESAGTVDIDHELTSGLVAQRLVESRPNTSTSPLPSRVGTHGNQEPETATFEEARDTAPNPVTGPDSSGPTHVETRSATLDEPMIRMNRALGSQLKHVASPPLLPLTPPGQAGSIETPQSDFAGPAADADTNGVSDNSLETVPITAAPTRPNHRPTANPPEVRTAKSDRTKDDPGTASRLNPDDSLKSATTEPLVQDPGPDGQTHFTGGITAEAGVEVPSRPLPVGGKTKVGAKQSPPATSQARPAKPAALRGSKADLYAEEPTPPTTSPASMPRPSAGGSRQVGPNPASGGLSEIEQILASALLKYSQVAANPGSSPTTSSNEIATEQGGHPTESATPNPAQRTLGWAIGRPTTTVAIAGDAYRNAGKDAPSAASPSMPTNPLMGSIDSQGTPDQTASMGNGGSRRPIPSTTEAGQPGVDSMSGKVRLASTERPTQPIPAGGSNLGMPLGRAVADGSVSSTTAITATPIETAVERSQAHFINQRKDSASAGPVLENDGVEENMANPKPLQTGGSEPAVLQGRAMAAPSPDSQKPIGQAFANATPTEAPFRWVSHQSTVEVGSSQHQDADRANRTANLQSGESAEFSQPKHQQEKNPGGDSLGASARKDGQSAARQEQKLNWIRSNPISPSMANATVGSAPASGTRTADSASITPDLDASQLQKDPAGQPARARVVQNSQSQADESMVGAKPAARDQVPSGTLRGDLSQSDSQNDNASLENSNKVRIGSPKQDADLNAPATRESNKAGREARTRSDSQQAIVVSSHGSNPPSGRMASISGSGNQGQKDRPASAEVPVKTTAPETNPGWAAPNPAPKLASGQPFFAERHQFGGEVIRPEKPSPDSATGTTEAPSLEAEWTDATQGPQSPSAASTEVSMDSRWAFVSTPLSKGRTEAPAPETEQTAPTRVPQSQSFPPTDPSRNSRSALSSTPLSKGANEVPSLNRKEEETSIHRESSEDQQSAYGANRSQPDLSSAAFAKARNALPSMIRGETTSTQAEPSLPKSATDSAAKPQSDSSSHPGTPTQASESQKIRTGSASNPTPAGPVSTASDGESVRSKPPSAENSLAQESGHRGEASSSTSTTDHSVTTNSNPPGGWTRPSPMDARLAVQEREPSGARHEARTPSPLNGTPGTVARTAGAIPAQANSDKSQGAFKQGADWNQQSGLPSGVTKHPVELSNANSIRFLRPQSSDKPTPESAGGAETLGRPNLKAGQSETGRPSDATAFSQGGRPTQKVELGQQSNPAAVLFPGGSRSGAVADQWREIRPSKLDREVVGSNWKELQRGSPADSTQPATQWATMARSLEATTLPASVTNAGRDAIGDQIRLKEETKTPIAIPASLTPDKGLNGNAPRQNSKQDHESEGKRASFGDLKDSTSEAKGKPSEVLGNGPTTDAFQTFGRVGRSETELPENRQALPNRVGTDDPSRTEISATGRPTDSTRPVPLPPPPTDSTSGSLMTNAFQATTGNSRATELNVTPFKPASLAGSDAREIAGTAAARQLNRVKTNAKTANVADGAGQTFPELDSAVTDSSTAPARREAVKKAAGAFTIDEPTGSNATGPTHSTDAISRYNAITSEQAREPLNTSAEHVLQQIAKHAVEFQQFNASSMAVVLKPDAETALFLHLKMHEGQVKVFARFERGDFQEMEADWAGIQQALAPQGILLAALQNSESTREFSWNGETAERNPSQGGHPRQGTQEREGRQAMAETMVAAPAGRASKPVNGKAARPARHWESWA